MIKHSVHCVVSVIKTSVHSLVYKFSTVEVMDKWYYMEILNYQQHHDLHAGIIQKRHDRARV